jgi:hypothetical protein
MQLLHQWEISSRLRGQRDRHGCRLCASITCMIRHYVGPKGAVIFDHPHNAAIRARMSQIS